MQRFYEFPFGDLTGIVISSNNPISIVPLKIVLPIVRLFLGNDTLLVNLFKNEDEEKYTFSNKNEKVNIFFSKDSFYISYNKRTYRFNYDFSNDNIIYELKDCSGIHNNIMYTQKFLTHKIGILITNSSQKLELIIPIDLNEIISLNVVEEMGMINDIESLKKFYFSYFFDKQTAYDKKETSILRIYNCISGYIVLTDELLIEEGFIKSYLISLVDGDFILSVKKPKDGYQEFVFNKIPDDSLNINYLSRKLSKRASTINLRL